MGNAIYVPGVDWSAENFGRVTLTKSLPVKSLQIFGDTNVVNTGHFSVTFDPVFTSQRSVVWSIVSGSEYATIDQSGNVVAKPGASASAVTIRATSSTTPSVYADKNITATSATIDYYDYMQADGASRLLVDGLPMFVGGKIVVKGTLTTANGYLMQSQYGSDAVSTRIGFYKRNDGDIGVAFGNKAFISTRVIPSPGVVYRLEMQLSTGSSSSDGQFKIYNDATDALLYTSTTGVVYLNADISVFCAGYSATGPGSAYTPNGSTYSADKLYGLQVYDAGGNLVRDLKAVEFDGVPALLDIVQFKAYYNLGAGTLIVGND